MIEYLTFMIFGKLGVCFYKVENSEN